MMRSRFGLMLCFGLAAGSALAVGPVSTLYVMNYAEFTNGTGLDLVQGVSANSFATGNQVDICIATYGDVRTMGYGQGDSGSKFTLAGAVAIGGPYVNTIPNSQLHDGTTDGSFNYSIDYTTGDVLRFSRNWTSPTTLFNVSGTLPGAGWITMNAADGSFWLSQWGGPSIVNHYSAGGTLLGSFNSGVASSAGLALDPADGTLWMSDFSGTHTLHQFSQAGNPLQSTSYTLNGTWYGMEFDTTPVPEPASMAVVGVGLVAIARRRVRRAK